MTQTLALAAVLRGLGGEQGEVTANDNEMVCSANAQTDPDFHAQTSARESKVTRKQFASMCLDGAPPALHAQATHEERGNHVHTAIDASAHKLYCRRLHSSSAAVLVVNALLAAPCVLRTRRDALENCRQNTQICTACLHVSAPCLGRSTAAWA